MLNYMSIFSWFKKNKQLGKVVHYFDKIQVAVIKLCCGLKVGDKIKIKRGEEENAEIVDSMQINHVNVVNGKSGDEVAIKVTHNTKGGAKIYRMVLKILVLKKLLLIMLRRMGPSHP